MLTLSFNFKTHVVIFASLCSISHYSIICIFRYMYVSYGLGFFGTKTLELTMSNLQKLLQSIAKISLRKRIGTS
ncbi:hypothetical protein VIGAN_05211400 [Vigna angularis var. angularis]|uniref:Uncharacterized protein n=1 Tax=Vigna angularis var. angularis TaxID=157739 RepID=A0A0S3S6Y8_PHAAN|nr:hypothetical protein VIGAN_05211400 [Vigna angularis var. angularis]